MGSTGWLGDATTDAAAPPPAGRATPAQRESTPPAEESWWQGIATRLVLAGLVLWAVAQALPAYAESSIFVSEPDIVTPGWKATLFGWLLGLLDGTHLVLVAWSANIWFLMSIVASRRKHTSLAAGLAGAAVACSAIGMWILIQGGLPDENPFAVITDVGIGSYLWFAGMCATFLGTFAAWRRSSAS